MKLVGSTEYGSGSKPGSVMGKVFESLAAPKFGPRIIGNGLGKHNSVPGFELIMPSSRTRSSGYPSSHHQKNGSKKGYGFAGLLISCTDPPAPYNLVRLPLHDEDLEEAVFGNVVVMEYCSSEVTSASSVVMIKDT